MLREFYFTKGSWDQFGQPNISSVASDVMLAKLVEGARGKVKILTSIVQ